MSDLEMWALVMGFVLPPLIALVQQPRWSDGVRAVVTFVICALTGTGTAYLNDAFTGRSVVSSVLLVLVMAIGTFKGFWKPTGVAPAIESATSPGSVVRP